MIQIQDHPLKSVVENALSLMPDWSLRGCGIQQITFEDLGVSAEYTPNHGYYVNRRLALNEQMVDDTTEFYDPTTGRRLGIIPFILYHEIGHGFDEMLGLVSEQEQWTSLSGWSKTPFKGARRITITDQGQVTEGEWCFDPNKSKFARYYSMRNPWDDFADSFAFYVSGMHGFLDPKKIKFLDDCASFVGE